MCKIKCESDFAYFLSPFGLGDTLVLAGLKDVIEKKYSIKIHFLIKKTHKVVMDMYNINDYSVVSKIPSVKELESESKFNKIANGEIFIAHPMFVSNEKSIKNFRNGKTSFFEMYLEFFNLDKNVVFASPKNYPEISDDLLNKLTNIGINNLEKLVLFAPEANSTKLLPDEFWEKEALKYQKDGMQVFVNAFNKKNKILGAFYSDLTMDELVALALKCKKVISLRSGFCDLIAFASVDLEILYSNIDELSLYSIKRAFNIPCKEQIALVLKKKFTLSNIKFFQKLFRVKKIIQILH